MIEFKTLQLSRFVSYNFMAIVVAVVGSLIGYQLWIGAKTMPSAVEGFAGPANGSGSLTCMRTSSEAAELFTMLSSKPQTVEAGADDLRELQVLLGKLACLKRDLMSPSGIVEATRKQPFRTSHDMEPVAETAARCFAKTIPKRDVELSLDKWRGRGDMLVRRLCTSANLTEAEVSTAITLFKKVMSDIADVMGSTCFKGDPKIAGQEGPRMITGFEPAALNNLREYTGYY